MARNNNPVEPPKQARPQQQGTPNLYTLLLRVLDWIRESWYAKTILGVVVAYYALAVVGPFSGRIQTTWSGVFPIITVKSTPPPPGEVVGCIWIDNAKGLTGNNCDFRVKVTSVDAIDANQNHQTIACDEPTCVFQAHQRSTLLSPPGLTIVKVLSAEKAD